MKSLYTNLILLLLLQSSMIGLLQMDASAKPLAVDSIDVPVFTLLTNDPTVDEMDDSWGICWVDYNNDGYDDLFVPNYNPDLPSNLYINNTDGTFTKQTTGILVSELSGALAASWADLDNNGYKDVVIANNVDNRDFIYLNNNQTLVGIEEALLEESNSYSHSVSFVDYDNDSFVDIYVSDYFESKANKLYRNNGDGSFDRIEEGPLVNQAVSSVGSTWGDVNNDGFMDVFVPVRQDQNLLFINNGDRSFTKLEMGDNASSVGCSFADIDNDGDLDLFVANASKEDNFLYRNDGTGNFTLLADSPVSQGGGDSHGSVFGDFNNDGWLDLFVSNDRNGVKFFYLNDGEGNFLRITNIPIVAPEGNSFGVASSDYDNDGDLDIAIANHSDGNNFIYTNEGNANNYLNIALFGTNSNASAIGTRIYLTATIDGEVVTMMREISAQTGGGPGSQNSFTQHFGLEDATIIDEIRMEWPSGHTQYLLDVATNQKLEVTEDNGTIVSGIVYNDLNGDCIQDANEMGIPNNIVNIEPGGLTVITDENGFYQISLPVGEYTVQQILKENYNNICPGPSASINVSVQKIGQNLPNNDFANTAIQILPDLTVDLGLTALRRGFENEMVISYSNSGAAIANNVKLQLTLDDDVSIAASDLPWDFNDEKVYEWNLGSIDINEMGIINLLDYVDVNAQLESFKNFTVTITGDETDLNYSNNDATSSERVVGSIDPNDILVSPAGYGPAHLINPNDTLTYKIRFQNLGNYPTSRIVVIDTLPEFLDLNTFSIATVSHDYEFEMLENGIVKFTFIDINLPFKVENESGSQGFIQFKIEAKKDCQNLSRIENRAAIQFDFKPFVITNTVYSTISNQFNNIDQEQDKLFVYPNPASEIVNVSFHESALAAGRLDNSTQTNEASFEIYNLTGQLVQTPLAPQSFPFQLDISLFAKGIYLMVYTSEKGVVFTEKLVVR